MKTSSFEHKTKIPASIECGYGEVGMLEIQIESGFIYP
jgi:hypothetical protein